MKPLYLSGPMTGRPELNFPAFHEAAAELRAAGLEVINPADLNPEPGHPWHYYMRRDIAALMECDGVATLWDWKESRGARLEVHIARELGLPVRPYWAWLLLQRLHKIACIGKQMAVIGRVKP